MEDFPMWVKGIIWLIVGSTLIYTIGAAVYYSFFA